MFNNRNNNRQQPDIQSSNKADKKIKWDAETVDYEEIKETNDKR